MKGNLIIISSPSGGGKGTLIRELLATVPSIGYSVSYTTRAMRKDEAHGRDYCFVSQEEFEKLRSSGEFLEFARVHDNLYATSRVQVEKKTNDGQDVILEIDVQGARSVLAKVPHAVSIFILPPSFEVLRDRLTRRATESSGDLDLRLKNSFEEVREYEMFQYVVVNNEVARATEELRHIILGERLRTDRQTGPIQAILDSFDISKYDFSGE